MRKFIATICLIVMGSYSAFAGGFSIYEASVRVNGMLGAFSAYANHVSTIYYNPAGLSNLEGVQFSTGATLITPRSTFRNLTSLAPAGQKTDMEKQEFWVPSFFGSYQITDGLTFGFGVYAPFGLGTKWPENWVGRGAAIETEIQTLFANPALAYTLPDFGIGKVQIGAGLQVAFLGDVKLSRAIRTFSPEGDFAMEGELNEPTFGFNAGLLLQPVEMIRLGFTYRSEVSTEFEGEAVFNRLGTDLGFPPTAQGGTTLDLPASWVAALNIKPISDLTLEVDYVWWGWSSYDELVIKFDQNIPALGGNRIVSTRNYEDTWQLRFGAEYTGIPLDGLTVRGGIGYDKNPIKERFVDPTLPDADRWLFSGGLTYSIADYLDVDASYIFIRAKQRRVENSISGIDGVYNTYANLPGLGVTLKF